MFLKLVSKTLIVDFAKTLADQVSKRYPPALEQQAGKRPSVARLTRIIEDVCGKAIEFQKENRLGWFGKARLGNTFRWALKEKGYRDDFVELATEALIVLVSKTPK